MLLRKFTRSGDLIEQLSDFRCVSFLLNSRQDGSDGSLRSGRIDARLGRNGIDEALKGGCHFANSLLEIARLAALREQSS
jgi:hypothetical protein